MVAKWGDEACMSSNGGEMVVKLPGGSGSMHGSVGMREWMGRERMDGMDGDEEEDTGGKRTMEIGEGDGWCG